MKKLIPYKDNLCSKYATKMLSIKINHECNRLCNFCVDKGGRNNKYTDTEKIANEAIRLNDYKTVIITGGEPFIIFDKVIELLEKIRTHKDRIVLNTNGSLLSKKRVVRLSGLIDELQVSIHHYDENKNGKIFNGIISFENIKDSLTKRDFTFSINSTFNNGYAEEEMPNAVNKMLELVKYLSADRLRLTELKKVDEKDFVPASKFFTENDLPSIDLITKGCTYYYNKDGVDVSVKRLCEFAKGKNAIAFSCCFINESGQKKIDIDTRDTFKVIYSDGLVTDDWIFAKCND
ncbi:MAG: radical SAM protein [Phycisphaerae bacterium]|nr:radical SAM protein [Phycisphaerae bacterium]MDD5239933.1 radical SAM protein [Candidatus Nanoarchaeia archaeon]